MTGLESLSESECDDLLKVVQGMCGLWPETTEWKLRRGLITAAAPRLLATIAKQRHALSIINDIRNGIVGSQTVNWSAHIYPLVAALDEAGFDGAGYEKYRQAAKRDATEIAKPPCGACESDR